MTISTFNPYQLTLGGFNQFMSMKFIHINYQLGGFVFSKGVVKSICKCSKNSTIKRCKNNKYTFIVTTMSVLLIGSTGHGKSTLGNFLYNPDHKQQTFVTARDNKPETQHVKVATNNVAVKDIGMFPLTLIDTPGLNESAKHDLSHMIDIILNLSELGHVKACVFVIKFNAKIDAQYKATIQYYSKLLPSLFDKNVLIVMTEYATDKRSEEIRARQGVDVEQIKRNTIRELCENANMPYTPILFLIDCLPFDNEERSFSLGVRNAILQYIHQLEPTFVNDISVAKTAYLKEKDEKTIEHLEGEVNGYNERLQEANQESKEALKETQKKEREVTKATEKLERLKSNLKDKDKPDTVVAETWQIEEPWKLMCWLSRDFKVTSPWKVANVKKWTNSKCSFTNYEEDEYSASGRVEGHFMRGLYASVELQTQKREKYAKDIKDLKEEIAEAKNELERVEKIRDEMQDKYKEHSDKIEILQKYIEQKREQITSLSSDVMTLEEALQRLDELNNSEL